MIKTQARCCAPFERTVRIRARTSRCFGAARFRGIFVAVRALIIRTAAFTLNYTGIIKQQPVLGECNRCDDNAMNRNGKGEREGKRKKE